MNAKNLKIILEKTFPVFSGYVCLGIGFGILLGKNGYGLPWAFFMSLFIYAGAMQYVAIGLLTGGAGLLSTALTTLMVNARHLFYGISMIDRYKGAGKYKPYMIFALTDETYSLVCSGIYPDSMSPHRYCFFVSLFNQCYWVLGSVIGSVLSMFLENFNTAGLDFAMTALFVTVFVEQWLSTKNHLSALIGLAASFVCLVIFGADNFLIPSMIAITVMLTLGRAKLEEKQPESPAEGGRSHE